jgi:hypothetical protein
MKLIVQSGNRLLLLPARWTDGTGRVQAWCAAHQIELVFLPTYGSWLNWIEAEFAALRYFALNGTDHRSHAEQNSAIDGYVRWHNIRATPKVNFATDSPIRTWSDYRPRLRDKPLAAGSSSGGGRLSILPELPTWPSHDPGPT